MRRRGLLPGPTAMSGMVGLWGASSLIESIQYGTLTITSGNTTATATISSVDMERSQLRCLGCTFGTNNQGWASSTARIAFTNATTLTGTRIGSSGAGSIVIGFVVITYLPGVIKSIQRGVVTTSGGGLTITEVNVAKTELDPLGWACSDTTTGANQTIETPRMTLASATSVTATNGNGDTNTTFGVQVVERY